MSKDGYHSREDCPVIGYGQGFCSKCTDGAPPGDSIPISPDTTVKTGDVNGDMGDEQDSPHTPAPTGRRTSRRTPK